ncbi:hypothetical protein [Alkalihalobacillus sp. AL-G]|uniref:hypothetical protein n=1 Tax=Alkalihalobacillus sp. AL-G TaxID=2926399 RepID=UPI00272B7A96|nr:hypothetical protein [Alkalihalobacillus sp. AL-G]WLD94523.1 hypothetical protein MOJ78_06455 [Alkalihalobacillus sp. AL-G]
MKKVILFLLLFTFALGSSVSAHVTNEKTLYDDIQFSKAKEEIVYLRGLDVIPYEHGVKLYKPNEKLTNKDLAFWASSFKGAAAEDAKREDIEKTALKNGIVDSLDGNATYADVNQAYFNGHAAVSNPDRTLTREEFALFMGEFFNTKVNGKTLFDMSHAEQGPNGNIEKVKMEKEGRGEDVTKVFHFTIDGQEYKVSPHPKMLYGPTDLSQWEGKKVKDSWLMGHGDEEVLQIVKLEKGQFLDNENEDQNSNSTEHREDAGEAQSGTTSEETSLPIVPLIGGAILLGIMIWLFVKKKK